MLSRREFVLGATAIAAIPIIGQDAEKKAKIPVVVSTWDFGKKANAKAWDILSKGGSALDAVEAGINDAELDPDNHSVGFSGLPNEDGEVTLDAVIMDGKTHSAGSVACLKRIKKAVSVARKVMEKTKHTLLVGDDATKFGVTMGFEEEALITEWSKKAWEDWKKNGKKSNFWNHDTIGMVAVDKSADIAAGCSTSGLGFKIAGRVGDSPIVGSGAYCDNDAGAAAATGNGDVMMRFCPAFLAVELMRGGASPSDACAKSLERISKKGYKAQACLIAVNKAGKFGAASINSPRFPYAVRNEELEKVLNSK